MARFDHVVVGAGIVGSCAALQLVKTGKKVLLLEQFSLPHSRGSSHGSSRMIRSCYSGKFFAEMMPLAFEMWKELEQSSGTTLLETTGVLCLSDRSRDRGAFSRYKSNMLTYSSQHLEEVDSGQLNDLYPMLSFGQSYQCFMDRSGGVLFANKALTVVQALFKENGGELWDSCPVSEIRPGNNVTIVTSRGEVICSSVVICAGAWTGKILKTSLNTSLPLQAEAVKVYYWKERETGTFTTKGGFPAFTEISSHPQSVYGLPSIEYPGLVKVSIHGGSPCDPDARERAPPSTDLEEILTDFVKEHLPGLEPEPAVVETCMYTLTPDEIYIVDVLPDNKNIVIGTGFSGTGFKTAPVIGKLLCELATGVKPSLDITPYRMARFMQKCN